jgi:ATP-dependent DNA helicase RecG
VSAVVASATASKADYIRTRAQDDEFYAKLVTDYLEKFGQADRARSTSCCLDKLSEALDAGQKEKKVANLLTKLRRAGRINNAGSRGHPIWKLAE